MPNLGNLDEKSLFGMTQANSKTLIYSMCSYYIYIVVVLALDVFEFLGKVTLQTHTTFIRAVFDTSIITSVCAPIITTRAIIATIIATIIASIIAVC